MVEKRDTDVFIVGGGPAGLTAAIAARQKGFRVTVADGSAPPIEKPCGEGMLPETLSALQALGVNIGRGDGQKFPGISFIEDGLRVYADFTDGQGLGLRRTILHQRLVERAAECGVQLLWRTPVLGIDGETARLRGGTIRARWIVGADGYGSRVRHWAGLQSTAHYKPRYSSRRHYRVKPWSNYMEIHWGRHTQAYVTPVGREEVCVVMMAETLDRADFATGNAEIPELCKRLEGAPLSSRERGAVTAMRTLQQVYRGNVALVGDASGGVDAITGEGLRLAFLQAFALADAMAANDLSTYQRAHRALQRRSMLMGNLMLWLTRSPRLRARVLRTLRKHPQLFARLLATHAGEVTCKQLVSTGAELGLRLVTELRG